MRRIPDQDTVGLITDPLYYHSLRWLNRFSYEWWMRDVLNRDGIEYEDPEEIDGVTWHNIVYRGNIFRVYDFRLCLNT
jgi:hypothetical protein